MRSAVAVAVLLLAGLSACGDDAAPAAPAPSTSPPPTSGVAATEVPEAVQHLEIVGTEYAFTISPDTSGGLRPGWTQVTFRNDGAEAHQVMFARLKDGVDPVELGETAAGDSSGAAAIEFVDMLGGVSYIGAGQTTTALVDLPEGLVIAMCYVPDPTGVAHALSGMTTMLTVRADAPEPTLDAPVEDARVVGTIELAADGYRLPHPMPAGWYRVHNTHEGEAGTGLHELSILRLGRAIDDDELATMLDDLAANRTPEVTLEALGGLGALSPGFEAYLYLDLPDGNYLAVDFMPDARVPRPHLLDGYHATFSPR